MKVLLPLLALFTNLALTAQDSGTEDVRQTIESFFDGFHRQDSVLMKQAVSGGIILQTIARDHKGTLFVKTEDFAKFMKSITAIPDSLSFREEIMDYTIKIDGAMANAWTTYEFWLNDSFSHCGVNSFQLFNDGTGWKIIYLIDTRRKEGCR
jgi:hypothetical protein